MTGGNPSRGDPIIARMDWRAMITLAAFILALAVVAARCTFMETLRDPFAPATGNIPRGPGAATSLALDLICCLPALLVLLRRAADDTYTLRFCASQLLMLPLAIWMSASFRWADDKFATLITSADFVATLALLWAMSQLVRSWLRLRIVVAVAYGLLVILLVQGFYWKLVEYPDTRAEFLKNEKQFFQQQGYDPGSFIAKQFEQKVLNGELMGFTSSPNSFAALVVLLMTIGAGAAIQRLVDHDSIEWATGLSVVIPPAIAALFFTGSKAAAVSLGLATMMLGAIAKFRPILARYSKQFFWLGAAAVLAVFAAVIGHGLFWRRLPTDSLNFRWRYWVASWHMFLRHPILGVGWDNFGLHYLRDRLPAASEEIRDPHNFIVRFFVELGAVGGILMLAWIARLWWEFTRPVMPVAMASIHRDSARAIRWIFAIAAVAAAVNVAASVDFAEKLDFIIIELMKSALFFCAFTLGALVVALRTVDKSDIDDRPAPWMLYAILVGLGIFLIHNLIEFSIFEKGPMYLFGLLAGSALGVRQINFVTRKRQQNSRALAALAIAGAVWIAAVIFIFVPTARAESAARAADAEVRDGKPETAEALYERAFAILPINADYAFRAAQAFHLDMEIMKLHNAKEIPETLWRPMLHWYSLAIEHNPSLVRAYTARASIELPMMDRDGVIADFNTALKLNPNEVSIRLDYARGLEKLSMPHEAAGQLKRAIADNDKLDKAEPKRLSPAEVEAIREKIAALEKS